MVEVANLYISPIKSCKPVEVPQALVTACGFEYDRDFVLIDEKGVFLNQIQYPRMCMIELEFCEDALLVRAPGMSDTYISLEEREIGSMTKVKMRKEVLHGLDQGDDIAEWFSTYLGESCRLIRYSRNLLRARKSDTSGRDVLISFTDAYPFLIISEASLADLNRRLVARGEKPLHMNRFRPTIVLRGCKAYEESIWMKGIQIGEIILEGATQCVRCAITTTNQASGERGKEPLRTLSKYRKTDEGVIFGRYYAHHNQGLIKVGDRVTIGRNHT